MNIKIPNNAKSIIDTLEKAGFEGFVVGGCVRDSLLNKSPEDWDITTSAKPEEVKKLFNRTIDTGIEHGTVTVMIDKEGYEVTTYRIDGKYTDGRHPESVVFTPSLEEDLKRRDFTINAMAYSPQKGLIDMFGGKEDLNNKIIRCVGDAKTRFSEDALRILRALRFSAQLGFEIDKDTQAGMKEIKENLKLISRERIQVELSKLLASDNPEKVELMHTLSLEESVFTEADEKSGQFLIPVKYPDLSDIKMLNALKTSRKNHFLRWSVFLSSLDGDEGRKFLRALKFDNKTVKTVEKILFEKNIDIEVGKLQVKREIQKIGIEEFDLLMDFKAAIIGTAQAINKSEILKDLKNEIIASGDPLFTKDLAINGKDLLEMGVKAGEDVGKTLEMLLEKVTVDASLNTVESLSAIVKEGIV